jgi:peptidoglycan/xylan/chitin deacetylase (PgdA/CDA1 family)
MEIADLRSPFRLSLRFRPQLPHARGFPVSAAGVCDFPGDPRLAVSSFFGVAPVQKAPSVGLSSGVQLTPPIAATFAEQENCQPSTFVRSVQKNRAGTHNIVFQQPVADGALRYDLALLDTANVLAYLQFEKGFRDLISVFHLFLISSLGFFASGSLQASNLAAASQRDKAPPPVDSALTFSRVHVDGQYIALTFDDGPNARLTSQLLDLLDAHHIKVTFFVIGQNVTQHPEIVSRAAREGHEIGNHSWSHPNLGKMSDEVVRRELQKTDDAIRSATGNRPNLMRPPYGSITARQKKWIKEEFGYKIILWDVDPLDWKRPGPAAVCNRIVRNIRAGSIILSHDIHPGTIEAMPSTIDQLEAKGFKFVTVSELISMALPETPKPSPTSAPSGELAPSKPRPPPNG